MRSDAKRPPDLVAARNRLREQNAALAARVKRLEDAIRDADARLYSIIDIERPTIEEMRARLRAALADQPPPPAVRL